MSPAGSGHVAFLWHRGVPLQTLISLKSASDTSDVTVLNGAISINNSGQILSDGQYQTGQWSVSVLMNPE